MEPTITGRMDWRAVHAFWFPDVDLDTADLATNRARAVWWMRGGANAELEPWRPVMDAARQGRLDDWARTPHGRLSLIVVLDQFPRGLLAGTAEAYACDPKALALTEEGIRLGHDRALTSLWERFFFHLPLAHAEGPDHLARADRCVGLALQALREAPEHLAPLYEFSVSQARFGRKVVARFGRHPHRNAILGRTSTPEEEAFLATGDFPHLRMPPPA